MSRFDGADVTNPNVRLFEHLPMEHVLKKLVAVHPKPSYGGRRSVAAATRSSIDPMKTIDTNLILIPVSAKVPRRWKVAREYFPAHELEYINELIFQIAEDDRMEQSRIIQQLNPPPMLNEKEAIEEEDDTSSSSSIPTRRSESIYIERKNDDFINTWLNNSKWKLSSIKPSLVVVWGFPMIGDDGKTSVNDTVRN